MTVTPTLRLNNGLPIPQLGFGVFLIPPEDTKKPFPRRSRPATG